MQSSNQIAKIGAVFIGVVSILAILGWFVWPGPSMQTKKELQIIQGYFDANRLDDAIAKADENLLRDPNNVDFLIAKAIATAQKGSLTFQEKELGSQAVTIANQAVRLDSKNSEAYRVLAYAYEIQQDYANAHENYQKALGYDPKNVAALYGDGHSYDLEGDSKKAAEKYQAALVVNGSFSPAYVGIARIALQGNNPEKALGMYQKSIEYTNNDRVKSESASAMALIYLGKGDVENAMNYSKQAIEFDVTYSTAWYVQGTTLFVDSFNKKKYPEIGTRNEMIKQSLENLEKAVQLNPNQAAAYLQIGTELSALGRADGAAVIFEKGLKMIEKDITLSASDKISMRAKFLKAKELMVKVEAVRNKKAASIKS
jgi:tetratricopeptide (TPR) repeat protein